MNDSQEPGGLPPQTPPPVSNIAGRYKRFVAALIDGVIGMAVSFPVFNHFGVWEAFKKQQEISSTLSNGLALFSVAMFFVLHGFLLYRYGQTIGKRIMNLAIVTLDGRKPAFVPLILNRYLPQWVVGFLPGGLGPLLAFGDILYIFFNNQNRCVHDLIAKTKVIDLTIKVEVAPDSIIA